LSAMVELNELEVLECPRSSVGLHDIYTAKGLETRERAKYLPNAVPAVGEGGKQMAKAVDHTGSVRRRRRCSLDFGSIHRSWSNSFGRMHVYGLWRARLLSNIAVAAARVRRIKRRSWATGESGERPSAS
jgi:hypothetical protein